MPPSPGHYIFNYLLILFIYYGRGPFATTYQVIPSVQLFFSQCKFFIFLLSNISSKFRIVQICCFWALFVTEKAIDNLSSGSWGLNFGSQWRQHGIQAHAFSFEIILPFLWSCCCLLVLFLFGLVLRSALTT